MITSWTSIFKNNSDTRWLKNIKNVFAKFVFVMNERRLKKPHCIYYQILLSTDCSEPEVDYIAQIEQRLTTTLNM